MERITPTSEQEEAIVKMVWETSGAVLNASTMGAGKTVKAVEVVRRRTIGLCCLLPRWAQGLVGKPRSSVKALSCLLGG